MAKILPNINTIILDKKFVSIAKAAAFLKVSPDTLRNWEKEGKVLPSRTHGGARRYNRAELLSLKKEIHPIALRKKGLLTVSQAAKALQVSADTIRNWDKKGLIDTSRSQGRARRFTREEISRLQKELGIEIGSRMPQAETKVVSEMPKIRHEGPSFAGWCLRIAYPLVLLMLVSASGWVVGSYIQPLEKKINDTSKLLSSTIGSVENLQKGVLGIQTQPAPTTTPLYLPANLESRFIPSYNDTKDDGLVITSVKLPLIRSGDGELSCSTCVTELPDYISSIGSDGTLSVSTTDKKTTVSLDLGHSNNWAGLQTFSGGLHASATGGSFAAIFESGNVGIGWTSPINKLEVAGGQTIGEGYAGNYKAPENGLLVQGNVGIGISAPSYRLDVGGGARFSCADANWTTGPATNCSDVAEIYESDGSIEVGEIVALTDQSDVVSRSSSPYQKGIIGVYSTSPALLVGGQTILGGSSNLESNKIPVALAGRVPLKVSNENGSVKVGDYLTSSSVPGVAMKATKPGPVLGQALESGDHLVDIKLKFKTILIFVNVSYADPSNFLASLNIDDQGSLIVPKIKTQSIILEPSIAPNSQLTTSSSQIMLSADSAQKAKEVLSELASLEERVKNLESRVKEQDAVITGNVGIGTIQTQTIDDGSIEDSTLKIENGRLNEASPSSIINPQNTTLNSLSSTVNSLELTPPEVLLATASATLSDLSVKETLSSDKLFKAQDIKVSGDLNVFGKTTLASTNVAGDLVVDGTLSITGNSVNVIGSPDCTDGGVPCGILYLQNSPLAYLVNLFNGLVTIDKFGNIRAQAVIVAEFKVISGKISGSGKIEAGSKFSEIDNPLVKPTSRILITPTQETSLVLAVTTKEEGKKFTVSSAQIVDKEIVFDWFLVNEIADE